MFIAQALTAETIARLVALDSVPRSRRAGATAVASVFRAAVVLLLLLAEGVVDWDEFRATSTEHHRDHG